VIDADDDIKGPISILGQRIFLLWHRGPILGFLGSYFLGLMYNDKLEPWSDEDIPGLPPCWFGYRRYSTHDEDTGHMGHFSLALGLCLIYAAWSVPAPLTYWLGAFHWKRGPWICLTDTAVGLVYNYDLKRWHHPSHRAIWFGHQSYVKETVRRSLYAFGLFAIAWTRKLDPDEGVTV
jgi:hypothetical protein